MPALRRHFTRLVHSNVRSFGEEQYLDMTDSIGRLAQWTLILGDIGVGKTTLLQCFASVCPVLAVPDKTTAEQGKLSPSAPTGVGPPSCGVRIGSTSRWRDPVRNT